MDLFRSIKRNDVASLRELIAAWANLDAKDGNGMTLLMVAVGNERIPLIQLRLKQRVRVVK
jgi:ankyrin repeat protein